MGDWETREMTEHRNADDSRSGSEDRDVSDDRGNDENGHATDPRLDGRYLRQVPATSSGDAVVLVGVTHDHPASRARVREVVGTVSPDVVALELSPLAVPLYRQYAAENDRTPDHGTNSGGEMAAALAACDDAGVAGIDAPTVTYARQLAERLRSPDVDRETAVAAVRDTVSVTGRSLACAAGAVVRASTPWQPVVGTPVDHDSAATDPPAAQAADEARHLSRSRALLGALEMPPGQALVDEVRESSMAVRLRSLRAEGSVVAVVGHAHLDPVYERLDGENG